MGHSSFQHKHQTLPPTVLEELLYCSKCDSLLSVDEKHSKKHCIYYAPRKTRFRTVQLASISFVHVTCMWWPRQDLSKRNNEYCRFILRMASLTHCAKSLRRSSYTRELCSAISLETVTYITECNHIKPCSPQYLLNRHFKIYFRANKILHI